MDSDSTIDVGDYSNSTHITYTKKSRRVRGAASPKIRRFDIEFSNDQSSLPCLFVSGSTLSGFITLDLVKPTTVIRVRVICEGFLRVSDTKKVVLSSNQVLLGPEKGRKFGNKLAAGLYRYPFTVDLPTDLPTTIFRNQLLKSNYRCLAILVRKATADDIVMERPFMVHSITDPVYEQVTNGQDSVDRSCPLVGNILTAQITLPRTGFFLGDRLNVSGLITNTSSSSRKVKVGIKIVRSIVGHGAMSLGFIKIKQTKSFETPVLDRWTGFFKVPKRGNEEFEVGVSLNLMEPTTKHELIDIEYIAHVSFVVQGMLSDSKPKEVTTAITIAPPRSLALYSPSYMSQAAEQAAQPLANAPMENDLNSSNIYPSLEREFSIESEVSVGPSAPEPESDEDNENIVLPSYEDVIAGKI